MNLPNKLTLLRICMTPVFIACFYIPDRSWSLFAALLFLIAYVTDIFDGQYARKHNIVTNFGKLMDPIADKLLTAAAFVMLVDAGLLSPIPTIIVLAREFIISGFRLVAVESGNVIAASWLGKIKTVSQCVAVLLVLLADYFSGLLCIGSVDVLHLIAQGIIWISVIFTIWSGVDYIVKNRKSVDFN